MKTKHTSVGLSLFVIVTALTFGMGGSHAQAELIYYEKIFEDTTSREFTDQERDEYTQSFRELNVEFEIGSIRLEEGEELSQPSQKLIQSELNYNGWGEATTSRGYFKLIINYDRFSKDEVITVSINNGFEWSINRQSGLLFSKGNEWPIEGPATVKVLVKPYTERIYNNNPKRYKNTRPEQFYRISFTKSLSQFRVSQNQLQALVLPKGVEGMSVIIESSDDLVNWTRDTHGPKATVNRPKFFRLRAVKE